MVKKYRFLILALMLFFLVPLLISLNKRVYATTNNSASSQNKDYYKRTEQIIEYELKNKENYLPKRIIEKSSNYYRNSLSDSNKLIYDNLVKKFLEIDFEKISENLVSGSNLLKLDIPKDTNLDNIKLIANYFLLDNPGLFFIKTLNKIEENTNYEIYYELYTDFTKNEAIIASLKKFILKTEIIKDEANEIPFLNKRLFYIFDKILTDKFKKVSKYNNILDDKNSAFNSIFDDKEMSKNSLVRLISYISNISDIKNIYVEGVIKNNFTSSVFPFLQDKFFYLDIYNYLNDKKEKYIHRYFLNSIPSDFINNNNILNKSDIADKQFDTFYKYSDGYIEYSNLKNKFRNRILSGTNPNPNETEYIQQGPMSDKPYDNFKSPFNKFYLPSKPNFKYEYYYINTNNDKSKTLPTDDGEYIYYIKSNDIDSYFEIKIRFKIAKRLSVLFKDDLALPNKKPHDVICYMGDYVSKPKKPEIDGYVFDGYINEELLEKPILNDLIIKEKYRKPKITFYDEDGKENSFLKPSPTLPYDSNSILKNVVPTIPDGHIFVGYQIKGTKQFIGTEFGNLPIISDISLVAIVHKIILDVKGSFFRRNKKIKNKLNTFYIHPKNRIPDLTRVKFGTDYITASGIKFQFPYDKIKTLPEYDITFIARSKNSYDEKEVKAHLIVNNEMFLTTGWIKKNWWLVVLIIILIILSPFLIRLTFKIIKKIRKSIKRKKKEKLSQELDDEIDYEKNLSDKKDYLNSLKKNNSYNDFNNNSYNEDNTSKNFLNTNKNENITDNNNYKTNNDNLENTKEKNDYFNSYTPFIEDYTIDDLKENNEGYGDDKYDENK